MKAWAKRMIWFFGIQVTLFLNDVANTITGFKVPVEHEVGIAIIWVILTIVPIILMGDDKK